MKVPTIHVVKIEPYSFAHGGCADLWKGKRKEFHVLQGQSAYDGNNFPFEIVHIELLLASSNFSDIKFSFLL